MKFSKQEILNEMHRAGIVPLFHHANLEIAKAAIEASYKAGAKVFEFTNRGEKAFEVFSQLIKFSENFPELMVGAGTIMTVSDAEKFIDAGAKFIISPTLTVDVAPLCKRHDMLWIPGTATLTEIVTAKNAGAELIKIFPGNVLGPKFVSAVLPVVSGLKLMPTGGVEPTEENLKAWFDAGVFCAGMGSQLFSKKTIEEKNWKEIENGVRNALAIATKVRS
jgi:2-dehydro-3-deoxyphosphogluconate aldolase/(4S)-4-hydroxy-2-oxoglutarate aldolase